MADFSGLAEAYASRNRATLTGLNQAAAQPMNFPPDQLRMLAGQMRDAGLDEDTIRAGFEKRGLSYDLVAPQSALGTGLRAAYQAAVPGSLRAGAGLAEMIGGPDTTFDDTLKEMAVGAEGLVAQPEGPATIGEAWQKGDLGRYAARQVGTGLGSTVPTILSAAAGTAVGGPAGGIAGAGLASYALQAGGMYNDLRDRGIDHEQAAAASGVTAIPMAALDVAGMRFLPGIGRFVGDATAPLAGGAARRAAVGAGQGAAAETLTEGAQQGIQEGVTSRLDPNYDIGRGASSILESMVAGGLTGGLLGAGGGVLQSRARDEKGVRTVDTLDEEPPPALPGPEQRLALPPPANISPEGRVYAGGPSEAAPLLALPPPTSLRDLARARQAVEHESDPARRAAAVDRWRSAAGRITPEPSARNSFGPSRNYSGPMSEPLRTLRPTPPRRPNQIEVGAPDELVALPRRGQSLALRLAGLRQAISRERDPPRRRALISAWQAMSQTERARPEVAEAPRRSVEERFAPTQQQRREAAAPEALVVQEPEPDQAGATKGEAAAVAAEPEKAPAAQVEATIQAPQEDVTTPPAAAPEAAQPEQVAAPQQVTTQEPSGPGPAPGEPPEPDAAKFVSDLRKTALGARGEVYGPNGRPYRVKSDPKAGYIGVDVAGSVQTRILPPRGQKWTLDEAVEEVRRQAFIEPAAGRPSREQALAETRARVAEMAAAEAEAAKLAPKPRAAKRARAPQSLIPFLAATGGIQDAMHAGELRQMGLDKHHVPFVGRLVRKGAKGLDYARERAAEAGYLPADSTIDDLLQLLDQEARGQKVYAQRDSGNVQERADEARAREEQGEVDAVLPDVRAAAEGYELTDAEMRRVAEIMVAERMDAADALDRFVEDDALAREASDADVAETSEDDPGGDIPFDAPFTKGSAGKPAGEARPAPEELARGGQEGDGARSQAAAVEPRAEAGAEGLPQLVLPGAERSTKQAVAARDAKGGLRRGNQKAADEGLFAAPEDDSPPLFRRTAASPAQPPPAEPKRYFVRAVIDGKVQSGSFEAATTAEAEAAARERWGKAERIAAQAIPPDPLAAIQRELRDLLRRIVGSRVRLDAKGRLLDPSGKPIAGRYLQGVISVALDRDNPRATVRHEAIHFLRRAGAIDAATWRALEKHAKQWRKDLGTDEEYAGQGLSEERLVEEAIAEAYARWGDGRLPKASRLDGPFGVIKRILQAIRDAIKRIWDGRMPEAEEVFAAIETGEFADRGGEPAGDGEAQYRRTGAASSTGTRPSFVAEPEAGPLGKLTKGLTSASDKSWWKETALPWLTQHYVNKLDPIARAEVRRFGKLQDASRSAFKLAEMAAQDTGRFEMMVKHGVLKWDAKAGVTRIDTRTGGLADIFSGLTGEADYNAFQGYAYAKRAQRLLKEGRERLMSPAEITKAMAVPAADKARYDAMLQRYQRFNEGLLDFLVDTGTLKPALRDLYASSMDYVPFYRVMEETGDLLAPSDLRKGLSNPDPRIKRLKGGTAKLDDLFDNISRNARALASAGLRNVAMQRTHDLLAELGEMDDVPGGVTKGDDTVSYYVNGQKRWFRPHDGAMLMALAPMPPERMGALYNALKGMAGLFRAGITLSPSFMVANAIRGFSAGWVQTGQNISFKYNTLTGFKNALKDSASIQAMKAASGSGGYRFGPESPSLSGASLRRSTGAEKGGIGSTIAKALDRIEHIGEASELAERDAIYNNLRAKGVSEAEAAYQAMNLVNFSRGGTSKSLRFLIPLVPFLNARIQGLYRMFENHGDRSVIPGIVARGALLMAGALGLWALNNWDEEDRERYENEPLERKLNYFIVYGPGDTKILIPKPFEFGALFATLPEALMDAMTKEGGGKDLGSIAAMTFLNTFSFNPIPAALLPALEVATNYDFFRGRPLESMAQERLAPELRAGPTTSSTARALGQVTGPLAGLSPVEVQHLLEGYFGLYGATFMAAADAVAGAAGILPGKPTGALGGVPIVSSVLENTLGRFVKRSDVDPASRWVEDLYDLKREADQVYASARYLRANGEAERARELMKDERGLIAARRMLDRATDDMADLNRRMNAIRADRKLSGAEMRAKLDPLIKRRNDLAKRVTQMAERRIEAKAA